MFRLLAGVVVPGLLLSVTEIGLRLADYGYPTRFFIPTDDGRTVGTNPRFGWQFQQRATAISPTPLRFASKKSPGTFRIYILGESAAAGTPDPAFGFVRMLELILAAQYPTNHFEFLNTAMRGVDSHAIRRIAMECAKFSPDLFVVYLGNNEMIGQHSPSPGILSGPANIHWQRFLDALRRSKLAQLSEDLLALLGRSSAPAAQTMDYLRRQRVAFDDSRREPVYRNYELNMRDICSAADAAGARTLLCTLGSNLRDFPPLGSLHRRDLTAKQLVDWEQAEALGISAETRGDLFAAATNYEHAARTDGHFAELLFRLACCEEYLGRMDEARKQFTSARDWDALQFRTDSRLNGLVRKVASESGTNVQLVDLEELLAASASSTNGVPGAAIFHDHVHFSFDGDYLVASLLAPQVVSAFRLQESGQPILSRDECARRLAYTAVDEMNVKEGFSHLLAKPPFLDQVGHAERVARLEREVAERRRLITETTYNQAVRVYREALAARPDDWMLRFNLGNLFSQFSQHSLAETEYREVVKQFPREPAFRLALGGALLGKGNPTEAAREFAEAKRLHPQLKAAAEGLAAAGARLK